MSEELKAKLTERFNELNDKADCDETNQHLYDALLKAYLAGGEYGYECAVDKACKLIKLHIGVDLPVRLSPDGQPLAEDFINHAEARAEAAQKVVEQFRKAMQ